MGRPGTAFTPDVIALVARLAGAEPRPSTREISRLAKAQGVEISKTKVAEILSGVYEIKRPSTARITVEEIEVRAGVRCPNGHLCTVLPCRTCRILEFVLAGGGPLALEADDTDDDVDEEPAPEVIDTRRYFSEDDYPDGGRAIAL